MMHETRMMYLSLDKNDELDVVCDSTDEAYSFSIPKSGEYLLSTDKQNNFYLKKAGEDDE